MREILKIINKMLYQTIRIQIDAFFILIMMMKTDEIKTKVSPSEKYHLI